MPCDSRRSGLLRNSRKTGHGRAATISRVPAFLGGAGARPFALFSRQLLIAAAMLLAAAPWPAGAQQEPDKSTSPAFENSIDRWNQMSPEERERELAKLPPARARLIRQRIARYNKMNPEDQQTLRERYQMFSQLPPDKQQVVRQRLMEFRHLPIERQTAVHRETVEMRKLPEAQRMARMASDDYRSRYSPQEQQVIRDLSTYLPR